MAEYSARQTIDRATAVHFSALFANFNSHLTMIPRGLKRYDCPQNTVIGVKKLSFQDKIGIFKCDSRKSEWDVSSLDASILLFVIFSRVNPQRCYLFYEASNT